PVGAGPLSPFRACLGAALRLGSAPWKTVMALILVLLIAQTAAFGAGGLWLWRRSARLQRGGQELKRALGQAGAASDTRPRAVEVASVAPAGAVFAPIKVRQGHAVAKSADIQTVSPSVRAARAWRMPQPAFAPFGLKLPPIPAQSLRGIA